MNIINEWERRLEFITSDLETYTDYLSNPNHELSRSEKEFLRSEITSKTKYKELIEETLRRLQNE